MRNTVSYGLNYGSHETDVLLTTKPIDSLLLIPIIRYLIRNIVLILFISLTLEKVVEDNTQKPIARCGAKELLQKLISLQSAFLVIFWSDILERFNMTSKKLQPINIDIFTVVELYESLIHYEIAIRNRKSFKKLEDLAKENSYQYV
jgi:hypothetical protein